MNIKELREQQGLSQEALAEMVKTSQSNISRWENGENDLSAKFLAELADALCCTTDELLGRVNEKTSNVEIIGEKVSKQEQKLLRIFRQLNDEQKDTAIQILTAAFAKK